MPFAQIPNRLLELKILQCHHHEFTNMRPQNSASSCSSLFITISIVGFLWWSVLSGIGNVRTLSERV
jgi:hypothetical protein